MTFRSVSRSIASFVCATIAVGACAAGCDLGDLTVGVPDGGADGPAVEPGQDGGGVLPGEDGGGIPVEGGPSADVCEGATFCNRFEANFEGWGSFSGYGGGVAPALDATNPLSPPYFARTRKPAPTNGGSTVRAEITDDGGGAAAASIGLSFSYRYVPSSSAVVTLAKMGLGGGGTVIVNAVGAELVVEVWANGAQVTKTSNIPADASSRWLRVDLDLAAGAPNRLRVYVAGVSAPQDLVAGSFAIEKLVSLELGIVYAPDGTENVSVDVDDVAVRMR